MSSGLCIICKAATVHYCGGCRNVWYCSVAHQKQHWELAHHSECGHTGKIPCASKLAESRRLWREHGEKTRAFILAYLDGPNESEAVAGAAAILMKNQEDIGAFFDVLLPGSKEAVTALLKEHITQAAAILAAAKNKNPLTELFRLYSDWFENAKKISQLAPKLGLSSARLMELMSDHLETTLQEALLHAEGNREADLAMYAKVLVHLEMMADYLVSNQRCSCKK